jgi:hypothetical protein
MMYLTGVRLSNIFSGIGGITMNCDKRKLLKLALVLLFTAVILSFSPGTQAGNIDPDATGCKYAWGENVGWINFKPALGSGVTVTDAAVTGMAWGENIGWINMSPASGYGGVANDGYGKLSGYAWGENVGWINFNPANGGVRIGSDGKFAGYAWGENVGWINFSGENSCVKTAWTAPAAANLTVSATAAPSLTRTFNWNIQKSVIGPTLIEQVGGSVTINYSVTVAETGFTDNGWATSGQIVVSNPTSTDVAGVNLTATVNNGGTCAVTNGTGITVTAGGSVSRNYLCTWSSSPSSLSGTVTATATAGGGSASGSAGFIFNTGSTGNPTNVNGVIVWIDKFDNATFGILGPVPTTSEPFASAEWTPLPFTVPVPAYGCATHSNTATIQETGQSSSAPTVTVCGPAQTGATGSGSWQNSNGQNLIKNSGSTAGICNLTTYLRQYAPFQDLSATATCNAVATYVNNVIKGANASGSSMNMMLKAQMLSTALSVYFNTSIGVVVIDLTKVCTGVTCSAYADVSAAFGSATSLSVGQMLAYAASQSNVGGSLWYGNVKSVQELSKDAFEAINNKTAFAP